MAKSFTTLTVPQKTFLESHLRGTERRLSQPQAEAIYGIKNLRARICEMRDMGLVIYTEKNSEGRAAYRMSSRDAFGSRAKLFV